MSPHIDVFDTAPNSYRPLPYLTSFTYDVIHKRFPVSSVYDGGASTAAAAAAAVLEDTLTTSRAVVRPPAVCATLSLRVWKEIHSGRGHVVVARYRRPGREETRCPTAPLSGRSSVAEECSSADTIATVHGRARALGQHASSGPPQGEARVPFNARPLWPVCAAHYYSDYQSTRSLRVL